MKKYTFRSILSFVLIAAMLIVPMSVFAATDNGIHMEGASIRTVGEQGLRFVGNVEKNRYELTHGADANFGIIMIPKSMIGAGEEITVETPDIRITPAKNEMEASDTAYRFNAVLTQIPTDYYGTELVARAYVCINGNYIYSEQIGRSVQFVANAILDDKNATATDLAVAQKVLEDYRLVGNDILIHADEIWQRLVVYPEYPEQINRDYLYDVSVSQGSKNQDLVVYNQTEAFFYQNRFDGGDVNRRFCEFAFDGAPVTVDIKVNADFDTYAVVPTSKGFPSTYADGVISVTVNEPQQFMIILDDDVNTALAVFADAPETSVPKKGDSKTVYVEGWNEVTIGSSTDAVLENGILTLSTRGSQIYIAPGAVLTARIVTPQDNADANISYAIKIFGRGAILDPASLIYHEDDHGFDNATSTSEHMVKIGGYSSVVQDIKILDSRRFNLNINRGSCTVQNVKILSTMMTSDGITTTANDGIVKDCFVYCGDNALVPQVGSGSKGYSFENITVGTTCSAIYPQYYCDSTFTDIYVFRADEGLISMKHGTDAKTIVINNLDALDCVRTPFLFFAEDVGSGQKTITLNKVLMRYTTGSATSSATPGTSTSSKALYSYKTLAAGSNYTFNITDLYVGGTLITSESQVKTSGSPSNCKKTYSSSGNTPAVLAGGKLTANYTCEDKVMIGARQVTLETKPIYSDGAWYLPYNEIVEYLPIKPTNPTTYMTKYGLEVIALDDLVASGAATAASYNTTTKAIQLTAAVTSSTNLIDEDYDASATFNPMYYKDKTVYIDATNNNGMWEYTAKAGDDGNGGIVRMILDEYRQYGKGTYVVTFEYTATAKLTVGIGVDHTEAKYSNSSNGSTSTWKSASVSFSITEDPASVEQMALWFRVSSGNTVSIRNVSLTKAN